MWWLLKPFWENESCLNRMVAASPILVQATAKPFAYNATIERIHNGYGYRQENLWLFNLDRIPYYWIIAFDCEGAP